MGNSTSIKSLVLFHDACSDGFAAAFAAWLKLGDEAEYVPMQYGKTPDIEDFHMKYAISQREVYILDFSLPKNIMDHLFSVAKRVVWLDHHKTAFEMWCGKYEKGMGHHERLINVEESWIELDDNKSGAYLAWEYFNPGTEVPMFVKHIDDYDRWQFKLRGTKAFNKALWSYAPWSFEQWKDMLLLVGFTGDEGEYNFYESGNAILRAHDQNVQSVVKGAARKCSIVPAVIDSVASYKAPWVWWHDEEHGDTCGANGLAANCPPHLTSDVGHELANQSGTFGLCWTLGQSGTVAKCSLRSNGEYDVSAIARTFGGGGHRNAAGFEVDIQTLLGWLK